MAARGAEYAPQSPGGHNTHTKSPAVTLERNNVVKFDTGNSFDAPRSPLVERLDSQHSELHRRTSLESKSERELQDMPQNAKEGLFARLMSYKWKSDGKANGKDLC